MEEKKSLWTKLVQSVGLQKLIALIALIVIFTFFAVSSESFRSFDTAVSILDASYYIGFLAIGVTFVIITGGIDLSIGTVMMCSAIVGGVLHTKMGWPLWLALLAILVIGGVFGLFNGIFNCEIWITTIHRNTWYNDDFTWFKLNRIKRTKCNVPITWNW